MNRTQSKCRAGGVALPLAFIPIANFFAAFLAFVGLVFGVIALIQKGRRKGLAIAGTVVSVVAGIIAVVMIAVYAAAFVAAVDESIRSDGFVTSPSDEALPEEETPADNSSAEIGTRENPAAFGSTVTLGAANLNATADVKAANQFNPDPEPGQTYAIFPATVKYIGAESGTPNFSLRFTFVSAEGRSFDGGFVVMDGQLSDVSELFTDAVATGNIVMLIPDTAAETGVWGVSYIAGDPIFIAVQ